MNLIDAYVTRVLSTPRHVEVEDVSWWEVDVEYDCYGRLNETNVICNSKEEAAAVCKGYKFAI